MKRTHARPVAPRRPSGRPVLETLEGRTLMSVGVTAVDDINLPTGGIAAGSIDAANETDRVHFAGHNGDLVSIGLTSTAAVSGFSARADLFEGSTYRGTIVPNQVSFFQLTSDGPYRVEVHDDNGAQTGSYRVGLESYAPPSPDHGVLVPGGIVGGSIDQSLEVDQFTFTAGADTTISLGLTSTALTSGFSTRLDLYTQGGNYLGTVVPNEVKFFHLNDAGTYMVAVHDNDYHATGSYHIGLESYVPPSPQPGSLVYGGIVAGSVNEPLEIDQFTFEAGSHQSVSLALTSAATAGSFSARADLYAEGGQYLGTVVPNEVKFFDTPSAGKYLVVVHDDNYQGSGTYRVGLESYVPPSPDVGVLISGGIVPGSIDESIEVDKFNFHAGTGELISLALTSTAVSSGFSARADLYTEGGNYLGTVVPNEVKFFRTPSEGNYLVVVHDDNYQQSGGYRVGLEGYVPPSPDKVNLAYGTTHGTIEESIEIDEYTLFARAGDVARLSLTSVAASSGFSARADVYTEGGDYLGTVVPNETKDFVLNSTGDVMVVVHDNNYQNRGAFDLAVSPLNPHAASVAGSAFVDEDEDGHRDAAEVGQAGARVYLDANGNGQFDTGERTQLTDVQGNYVFTGLRAGTYSVREVVPAGYHATSPAAGRYAVTVNADSRVTDLDFGNADDVAGRYVFYNRSAYDGNNAAANAADDGAVAPDKAALRPGRSASFSNVSSYSRGINGVMVDLVDVPAGAVLTAADFSFRVSSGPGANAWTPGPAPAQVTVRRCAGVRGSDRVTLTWPDYNPSAGSPATQAVANGWLEVTVKANGRTGLDVPDVFAFGNLIGETGNAPTSAMLVNAIDLGRVRGAQLTGAGITSALDFNRDGRVNAVDLGLARVNQLKGISMAPRLAEVSVASDDGVTASLFSQREIL